MLFKCRDNYALCSQVGPYPKFLIIFSNLHLLISKDNSIIPETTKATARKAKHSNGYIQTIKFKLDPVIESALL